MCKDFIHMNERQEMIRSQIDKIHNIEQCILNYLLSNVGYNNSPKILQGMIATLDEYHKTFDDMG